MFWRGGPGAGRTRGRFVLTRRGPCALGRGSVGASRARIGLGALGLSRARVGATQPPHGPDGEVEEAGQHDAVDGVGAETAAVHVRDRVDQRPHAVHALVEPYSTRTQLARLFERHRELQGNVGGESNVTVLQVG